MGDGQPGIQQYLLSGGFRNIPEYKLTLFSPEKEGDNYQGISVLRSCYKDWYMKDLLVKINAMSHERHGLGIPKVTVKGQVSSDESTKMREAARNLRAGEEAYIETTENLDLEILDMKASTRQDILPSIEFHTKQIFQSILAQFLQLSQSSSGGGTGSKALSEDMSKLFMRSLEFVSDYIADVFNTDLVKDLIELNWGKGANIPILTHEKIGDDNLALISDALSKLVTAGVITNTAETEQFVRGTLGLPELTDKDIVEYNKPEPEPKVVEVAPPQKAKEELSAIKLLNERITKVLEA
jgi:phage gp29-like protein